MRFGFTALEAGRFDPLNMNDKSGFSFIISPNYLSNDAKIATLSFERII